MSDFVWVCLPPLKGIAVRFCCSLPRPSPRPPGLPQFTSAQILGGCPPPPATSPVILASQGGLQPIPVTGAFLGSTRGRNSPAGDLGKLLDLPPGAQAGLRLGLPHTFRTEPPAVPPAPAAARVPRAPGGRVPTSPAPRQLRKSQLKHRCRPCNGKQRA